MVTSVPSLCNGSTQTLCCVTRILSSLSDMWSTRACSFGCGVSWQREGSLSINNKTTNLRLDYHTWNAVLLQATLDSRIGPGSPEDRQRGQAGHPEGNRRV